jgi:AcrR family transcriptional regulator
MGGTHPPGCHLLPKGEESMEHSRGSTKRADAVTNRARILEAAQSVFAERGLDLEMSEVAAQAHLGIATLYGHFANREELLRAIIEHVVDDALAQMRSALASAADDPRAALQALVFAGLHVQYQYRPLFGMMRAPRRTKLLDPSYGQTVRTQFLAIPRELIEHGIKAGIFRDDLDTELAAAVIMGSFMSAFDDLLGTRYSEDELAQRLFHLLLTMLTGKTEKESFSGGA